MSPKVSNDAELRCAEMNWRDGKKESKVLILGFAHLKGVQGVRMLKVYR